MPQSFAKSKGRADPEYAKGLSKNSYSITGKLCKISNVPKGPDISKRCGHD